MLGLHLISSTQPATKPTRFIIKQMFNAIMGSPEFDGWDDFAPPFGLILYYIYNFIVIVILLNVLIALYNSAYEDITGNSIDEYMALFSQKTMQFVRAPDENVYIAPLNLIEIVISGLFEWWMPKHAYERINDWVMGALYSPLLVVAAFFETREAHDIRRNRARGEEDDDTEEEWEQMAGDLDFESEGWTKTCEAVKINVEDEPAVMEIKKLREEVEELKTMLADISRAVSAGGSRKSREEKGESSKGGSSSGKSD